MQTDPRTLVESSKMSLCQLVAIGIAVGICGLDGFDIVSIAFAAPGIASQWGIGMAELGIVLSAELIGMAVGSVVIGGITDKIGRRPVLLGCLVAMSVGMAFAGMASTIPMLMVWRVLTGLGIGGALAAATAATAEHSNTKNQNFAVSIMAIGYPVMVVIGGLIAAPLLEAYGWRSVFVFGACLSAAFIPITWFGMPETIAFLTQNQPRGALKKVNRILHRMGHSSVDSLPEPQKEKLKGATVELFSPELIATTLLLAVAYFTHVFTFYFLLKWLPKILVNMGFDPATGAHSLVWMNVGGALGGILLGVLGRRYSAKSLTASVLFLSFIAVSVFGLARGHISAVFWLAALGGFFTNAGIVGLYSMAAQAFPTKSRASGTGFMIGVGRGGSALSPIVAGFLFAKGMSLETVAFLMGLGSFLAMFLLFFLRTKKTAAA